LPPSKQAILRREAAKDDGPVTVAEEKLESASEKHGGTRIVQNQSDLRQPLRSKAGPAGVPSLTEQVMGFANGGTSKDVSALLAKKSSASGDNRAQEPVRPVPPPPGIGSGGSGPGGSFNVEPPQRVKETPEGFRSVSEVLNETRTPPSIPDSIPSTRPYCWPGDPACRKRPAAAPKPRSQNLLRRRGHEVQVGRRYNLIG
jgi:hypothetical protein